MNAIARPSALAPERPPLAPWRAGYCIGWRQDAAELRRLRAPSLVAHHRKLLAIAAMRGAPIDLDAMRELRRDLRRTLLHARRLELAARLVEEGHDVAVAMDKAGLHNPFGRRAAILPEAGVW